MATLENSPYSALVVEHNGNQFLMPPALSIVVPTRNEAGNIAPLLNRIQEVLSGFTCDVTFVDDSTDSTPDVICELAEQFPFEVNVIARPPERRNGLGKAVVEGLRAAKSDLVVVMDGDLQHPPEVIPQLYEHAQKNNLDVVMASRLAKGGGTHGLSLYRKCISYGLAFASRIVFPRNLRTATDPMTGFFMVRRSKIDLDELQPNGFKILLEVLCKNPELTVGEIPFKFAERVYGESKADGREMLRLFNQIIRLRFGAAQHLVRFLLVGFTGIFVNSALIFLFTDVFKIFYVVSAVLATQGSTLWNFMWTEKWVFREREEVKVPFRQRIGSFFVINNVLLAVRTPLLVALVSAFGIYYLIANFMTLLVVTALRFVVADKFIWHNERKDAMAAGTQLFCYDIHGIIKVRSMQRLPELGYFKTNQPLENPDIDVMICGNPSAHKQADSITYSEFPGRLGFSIVVNRSEEMTQVYATPLIGMSPHVLYTNAIEPLLRWGFVRKGYALMHGATISFGGQAIFITAQTDTGKTTTILYTIQHNLKDVEFLSDDMTIFRRDGQVFSYPKPLTISQHTLQAVGGSPLSKRERRFLRIQSRLHSRGGRRVGMLLSMRKFPAATLNAIVQAIIPPPKYMVDKLVPGAQYTKTSKLSHIVLIERGPDFQASIDNLYKVSILEANAEDAYGFPPYPVLADQLCTWNGQDLHVAEREIVAAAIEDVPGTFMRDSNYGWYKRFPQLVKEMQTEPVAVEDEAHALFQTSESEDLTEAARPVNLVDIDETEPTRPLVDAETTEPSRTVQTSRIVMVEDRANGHSKADIG